MLREGSSFGPASRVLSEGSILGVASRVLEGSGSPPSRVVTEGSGGPPSRVVPEGPSGAAQRTPAEAPRTGRTQPYELLHFGDTDLVACVGPCLVVLSHELSLDAVAAMGRGMAKLEHRYGKLSSLAFVERKGGPTTASEARDAIAELVRKHAHAITGAAVVCEGTGFRATAIRSVVTAIHMASRSSHSSKVFAAPEPALEWLASTRSDGALDARLLLEACTLLRAKLQAQFDRAAAREPG